MVARKAEVPVVPLWIDGTRETWFAPVGGRFFRRWPRLDRPLIQVFAGEPIEPEEAEPVLLRERLLELGAKAFEARPELENHLGEELIRALKSRPWRTALIETYPERRVLSRGMLLAVASLLADRWRSSFDGRRVGVVLPPGAGATVANLALVLADKIPVNLNFTLGKGAAAHCIKRGELGAVVTAAAMQEKVGDFPWPDRVVDIKEELQGLGKGRILRRLAMIGLLPSRILRRRYDLSEGGDREAGLLFTSGSSGVPKGVPLSHRNLIANIRQIDHCGLLRSRERMLGCLPVFHSFGFTVTLWYPLLRGLVLVTSPSPLETGRLAGVIEAEKVTIYFGTPTFMRTFLKRVEPNQLASLQLAVAGAEKLPQDLAEAWEERFGVTVLEGYGLTETSPVVAANLPDPHHAKNQPGQPGGRRGSVGRPLPGVAVRLRKPESDELVPLTETGVLEVSGPNVFRGYLGGKNATAKAMTEDGWFVTGDLARMDEDGFLFIEGRISRFSKIGGEMVPHGLIEETLIKAKDWGGEEKTPLVVMGVPDKSKGEALILLTRHKLEKSEVREILSKADLPNLWVPRKIVSVEEIPSLASGKLDLRSCRDLAEKAADESGNGTGDDDGGGDDGEENSSGNEGRKGKDEKS
ncbi:MAG: AMP-dependent synthetase [Puniceicoccaceae bacterium]|nr:MAG: AMP-dependent synthetase [Puniceicoccaceae bacterium]